MPGRFVSPDWRDSEADLLFSVEREARTTPVLLARTSRYDHLLD